MAPLSSKEIQRMRQDVDRVGLRIQELNAEVEGSPQLELLKNEVLQLQQESQSIVTRTGCVQTHPCVGDPVAPPKEVWDIYQFAAGLETKTMELLKRAEQRTAQDRSSGR
jgi:cytochrome c551/c552